MDDFSERTAHITASGKLHLPASQRRLVGLDHAGPVRVRVVDGGIHIRSLKSAIEEIQAIGDRLKGRSSVEAFVRERREEALADADDLGALRP